MSNTVTTRVQIFDNEYPIRCAEDELDDLTASASALDERMRRIRNEGKVASLDRVAVVAALNIAHDNLRMRRKLDMVEHEVKDLTTRLHEAIEQRQH